MEQLELPLWEVLKEATSAPEEADVQQLLDVLDQSLSQLDIPGQLQVAAEAIAQIVQVFQEQSSLTFEELEATNSDEGPVMPQDAFNRYVRQTMELDFEPFIEPLVNLPRKLPEHQTEPAEQASAVGELDQAALLQALDEQMKGHPEWTEVEAFNQAISIAHDEDVSKWVEAIAQWTRDNQIAMIPLRQLQQETELPLVQLWLALLLGGFAMEQRGEFYETGQIWVLGQI